MGGKFRGLKTILSLKGFGTHMSKKTLREVEERRAPAAEDPGGPLVDRECEEGEGGIRNLLLRQG